MAKDLCGSAVHPVERVKETVTIRLYCKSSDDSAYKNLAANRLGGMPRKGRCNCSACQEPGSNKHWKIRNTVHLGSLHFLGADFTDAD